MSEHTNSAFNKECSICLTSFTSATDNPDEPPKTWVLDCKHEFHWDCLKGMNKLVCPVCRSDIKNVPHEIKQIIEQNAFQYRQEQDAEYEMYVRRMIESERVRESRVPPEIETASALQYLSSLGIPRSRIPHVGVEIDTSMPLPPQGTIFNSIVSSTINRIQEEINENVEEEDYSDEDLEEDSSGEEVNFRSMQLLTLTEFLAAAAAMSAAIHSRGR